MGEVWNLVIICFGTIVRHKYNLFVSHTKIWILVDDHQTSGGLLDEGQGGDGVQCSYSRQKKQNIKRCIL